MALRALQYFLLSRPYSFGTVMGSALVVASLTADQQTSPTLFLTALLLWISLNFVSERIQHDPGRLHPSFPLALFPLAVAALFCFLLKPAAITYLIIYTVSIFLYPQKAKIPPLGPFGPVFRGLTVIANMVFLASFIGGSTAHIVNVLPVILVFALLHVIRNLVGDLRDIEFDKYELPARFGLIPTMLVCLAAVVGIVLTCHFSNLMTLLTIVILSISVSFIVSLAFFLRSSSASIAGYWGHRTLVIILPISQCAYALSLGAEIWPIAFVLLLTMGLHFTYRRTPGKNYHSDQFDLKSSGDQSSKNLSSSRDQDHFQTLGHTPS